MPCALVRGWCPYVIVVYTSTHLRTDHAVYPARKRKGHMGLFTKIFGDPNEKEIRKLRPIVEEINSLEEEIEPLSDDELRAKTAEYRERYDNGESLDELLPEAFATVREASKREIGQRHYDVQLIGGIVLHQGKIAE